MKALLFLLALIGLFSIKGVAECRGKYEKQFGKVVYTDVDKMPSSEIDIPVLIAGHLNCSNCREEEYESRYVIEFVVGEDGSVTTLTVNGNGSLKMNSWENAVYNTFRMHSGTWSPGVCAGKSVSVRMRLPLTICL